MRTRTLTSAALLAAAALAGCSSTTSPKAAPASPTPTVSKQDQFLSAVHKADIASWATAGPTDDDLLLYPDKWCTALDEGHSVTYILDDNDLYPIGMSWGTKKADAQKLVVLAVTAYCPKYRGQVVQELQATGGY